MKFSEFISESANLMNTNVNKKNLNKDNMNNAWNGDFDCTAYKLKSLKGCPQVIFGTFSCAMNFLKTLRFGPREVVGEYSKYDCSGNMLTNLLHMPKIIGNNCYVSDNHLTSLKGCPKRMPKDFRCQNNALKTLIDGPEYVGRNFDCSDNKLTSLEGAPKEVGGSFDCGDNLLTQLSHIPEKIKGNFTCSGNKLTSLVGGPTHVKDSYLCSFNPITSLEGIARFIGHNLLMFHCDEITTLKDIHEHIDYIGNIINLNTKNIKSNVLGLLLIDGLKAVVNESGEKWADIVNRYIGKGRKGMIDCQNELIEAGLEEYAQL